MCGIVGYVGTEPAAPILIEGLNQLEYRGYDSAGIAVTSKTTNTVNTIKTLGRVKDLQALLPKRLPGTTGIGHTRWATHGPATNHNAHPHSCSAHRFHVVHNGMIDNAAELRAELESQGVDFTSDTDTEVIAHLVNQATEEGLSAKLRQVTSKLIGSYALAVLDAHNPDRIAVARLGSPLVLGIGDGHMHIASDPSALVRHSSRVVYLEDGDCCEVTATSYAMVSGSGAPASRTVEDLQLTAADVQLGDHDHFMIKEILEQPDAVRRALQGRLSERFGTVRLDGLNLTPRQLREFDRIKFLGCGSAYYIGQLGAHLTESIARMPADAEPASEFRYRNPVVDPKTLYVVLSQSGETADTLFAVQEIQRKGGFVAGLVNVVGSSIAREVSGGIYLHAGAEISVASTKALTNMGVAVAMLAIHCGRVRDLSHADGLRLVNGLQQLPDAITAVLSMADRADEVGKFLAQFEHAFFLGRVGAYPIAREGAQKLKEISYLHAEAYPTSELKHGPLALIDPQLPSVVVLPKDGLEDRNVAAIEQIQARGGPCVVVASDGVEVPSSLKVEYILSVPDVEPELAGLVLTVPLQLMAYYGAVHLGSDVDKPRNLAKSVTVE